MSCFFNHFISLPSFNASLVAFWADRLRKRTIHKNECLLRAGEVCTNLYAVETGALVGTSHQINRKGVTRFLLEGDVWTVPDSFFFQRASLEEIIAEKDCLLYYITYTDFTELQQIFPDFNFIVLDLLLTFLRKAEDCAWILRLAPVEVGYRWLETNYPAITRNFTGKALASYLGVSEVMLSRIRSKDKQITG